MNGDDYTEIERIETAYNGFIALDDKNEIHVWHFKNGVFMLDVGQDITDMIYADIIHIKIFDILKAISEKYGDAGTVVAVPILIGVQSLINAMERTRND